MRVVLKAPFLITDCRSESVLSVLLSSQGRFPSALLALRPLHAVEAAILEPLLFARYFREIPSVTSVLESMALGISSADGKADRMFAC